jgi:hypothetical protein
LLPFTLCRIDPIDFILKKIMGNNLTWTQTHANKSKIESFPKFFVQGERLLPLPVSFFLFASYFGVLQITVGKTPYSTRRREKMLFYH